MRGRRERAADPPHKMQPVRGGVCGLGLCVCMVARLVGVKEGRDANRTDYSVTPKGQQPSSLVQDWQNPIATAANFPRFLLLRCGPLRRAPCLTLAWRGTCLATR